MELKCCIDPETRSNFQTRLPRCSMMFLVVGLNVAPRCSPNPVAKMFHDVLGGGVKCCSKVFCDHGRLLSFAVEAYCRTMELVDW